jgi:hypothetical protein
MKEFINERQTSAFRKFKYAQLIAAGVHYQLAQKARDYKVTAVIGTIARKKKTEYAFAHYDFYTALAEEKIELWREEIPSTKVELTPEEDHEPEEE